MNKYKNIVCSFPLTVLFEVCIHVFFLKICIPCLQTEQYSYMKVEQNYNSIYSKILKKSPAWS